MSLQPPVEDADHVFGPLAGREAASLLEARKPVVGVPLSDDEERLALLADGEFSVYLGVRGKLRRVVRLHSRARP